MSAVTLTAKEFAEKIGIDYSVSLMVLKFLESKGIVTRGEDRPSASKKDFGRTSRTFNVPVGEIILELIPVPVNSEP